MVSRSNPEEIYLGKLELFMDALEPQSEAIAIDMRNMMNACRKNNDGLGIFHQLDKARAL